MDDELFRILLLSVAAAAIVIWLAGGFATSVAGSWRDGESLIHLRQWGPWVWGVAVLPDGKQRYRGIAFWGRLRLNRWDSGAQHLKALGFTDEQLPLLGEAKTGHFELHLAGGELHDQFFGRRFTFENKTYRNDAVADPVPRHWRRS